ncbi:hypothetical protein RMSM_02637 [Rhodopirellula maiorica SM1]|uniref:Uncharacterized protein n=1 Tax=Rhodopirellula maiorica SM1 TaxID=1265738 RepID=M5S2L8_9BACT|nr:hypothetical protein RMSM_02637 [Rhodopirellula maiorica SM1]
MTQQVRVYNDVRIHFFRAVAAREVVELRKELLRTARPNGIS